MVHDEFGGGIAVENKIVFANFFLNVIFQKIPLLHHQDDRESGPRSLLSNCFHWLIVQGEVKTENFIVRRTLPPSAGLQERLKVHENTKHQLISDGLHLGKQQNIE